MKIDKRKNYYLTIDTETANGLDCPLMYDLGGCIHDKKGNVMESFSFIIYEVYRGMRDIMQTAYYAWKIPNYEKDLESGKRKMVRLNTARKVIKELCDKYDVKAIIAHNASFDYRSTNNTQRFVTSSKYRYFLPYGIPVWDTLKMAQDTICKQKSYIRFCEKNDYLFRGRPRATAEILFRYMIGDNEFKESHTGLEDVLIEKDIFARCMRQHKAMRKSPWIRKELTEEERIARGWEVRI